MHEYARHTDQYKGDLHFMRICVLNKGHLHNPVR